MRDSRWLFAAATALAAVALVPSDPLRWIAALAAAGLAAISFARRRPWSWGLRAAFILLIAYLAFWGWFRVESWNLVRSGGDAASELERAKRQRVAEVLAGRLTDDGALLRSTIARLGREPVDASAAGPDADLFVALDRASPPLLPTGIGFEIYDREGRLRAWWGDPRGDRLPPDSVATALERPLVRAPSGYTLAYLAAPWTPGPDTFRVLVKDLWAAESPIRSEMAEADLLVPRLESAQNLAFHVAPPGFEDRREGEPAAYVSAADGTVIAEVHSERFLIDRYLESRRDDVVRVLALLLLWPIVWSLGFVWHATRQAALERRREGAWIGWALAVSAQAGILAGVWLFLVESRIPSLFLPGSWFSPLAFAAARLGPAGHSAGDFALTAAFLALFAVSTFALLPDPRRSPRGWVVVAWTAGCGVVSMVALQALAGALEGAMANMSPPVFFSPTILFSPPFLMVLLGFALFLAAGVILFAAGFRVVGAPTGPAWVAGAGGLTAVGVGLAAWRMPEAALSGERAALVVPLAVALVAGAWIVQASAGRKGRPGAHSPRLALAAAAIAALVTLPLAAHARVQAAHELLVERAERIGQSSSQWLQYTMGRTVQYLEDNPLVRETILGPNRDGALAIWSRSPLRDLDYATALYVFDAEGVLVSQFALTAEDLAGRARSFLDQLEPAEIPVEGAAGTTGARWAVVPVEGPEGRIGTAVAMTTEAVELRPPSGSAFLLTDLLSAPGSADLPGYELLAPGELAPPRTLLTSVRSEGDDGPQLAMPLDPLLPGARSYAVFVLVGALIGLAMGGIERASDAGTRSRWRVGFRTRNPLRSFRVQLLLAFLAVAAVPLGLYAVLGYQATRAELESGARTAAADALAAASRLMVGDPSLAQGSTSALGARLRTIAGILQQDLILYWRGRTVASSRPEIFASQLFADRMPGEVYVDLFAVRQPTVFDETSLGNRSFLVAYTMLDDTTSPPGYSLATPLLIREDRMRIDLQRLGEGVFLLSAFSIGFLLVVGWWLARAMTRPLSALERGTRQIASGHLGYRLPPPTRRDEFGRLQRSFNAMGERLDESQRALEREKSRVQAILSAVGAGVVALDGAGRVRLINDRAADLLEQPPAEVVDRTVDELVRSDGAAAAFWREVEKQRTAARRGDRDLVLRRNGEERHYHLVCTRLADEAGGSAGIVVAFEDITANVQSQRILAWGEMARQVAHEIKNPLTPMKLSLQHLEHVVEDRAPDFEAVFHENLDLVLVEIERLERIAGNFARFGAPDPIGRAPFDALAAARETIALYAPGEEAIEYRLETRGEPAPLVGDPDGFRRVLVNLLQNAREAILGRGTGTIEVRLDWEREPGWGRVSVLDDGCGLPAEGLERLFEPSFSTKTRGTGLGLAITRRIVESWGGSIDWERRDGGGTAMHVRLRAGSGDGASN
ncbi:MAG TPA: ATP-binding protein [Gemmatimonadota bacterium]|nr:ATP-binding protein [Gemmatimonadota bacterium]